MEMQLLKKSRESKDMLAGSATWLARGLDIEESAILLWKDVRSLRPSATEIQKLAVARRTDRLSSEIQRFITDSSIYMGDAFDTDGADGAEWSIDREDYRAGNDDEDIEEVVGGIRDDIRPPFTNCPILPLPSTIGGDMCGHLGLAQLAKDELELRIGQANDALHALRLSLAEKSMLFRNEVRHAKSQATTTRAWDRVRKVDIVLQQQAAIYKRCRAAIVSLDATAEELKRYRPLTDADLKVSAAITNPDGSGHRNASLAWFWTVDSAQDQLQDDWMSECGSSENLWCEGLLSTIT